MHRSVVPVVSLRRLKASAPALLGAAAVALAAALSQPVGAIPRLDLSLYPAPAQGERRWVIQLPGVLPPNQDPALSPDPRDWRVQLVVGQMAETDCNSYSFTARLRAWNTTPKTPQVYRVDAVGPLVSTRMACPETQPRRSTFVPMAGKPYVIPYKVSWPIVVYAPANLQLRWRLWKAERATQPANAL